QAEDSIRDRNVTGVQTCALPISLKVIRKQGYAFSNGEQDADTTGVSYPIYNHYGQVTAALTVSGLSSRFKDDNLIFIKKRTKKAAKAISIQLGYRGDVFNE